MTNKKAGSGLQNLNILFLIVGLAFALNLHGLAADSFWGDEILTASFAAQSPAKIIHWTAEDIHPPLYYLIAGTFARFIVPLGESGYATAASDWLWRFPSVIAVVLSIAVTYKLAYRLTRITQATTRFSYLTAVSTALLLALSPVVNKYSQEARMHALFMLFSALSTLLLLNAMRHPRRWTGWLAYALVTAANIYTMYFGFLILATHGVFVLSVQLTPLPTTKKSSQFSQLTGFSAAVLLAFILYAPWWPVLFNILQKRAAVGAIEGGVGNPLNFVTGVVQALGPPPNFAAWGFFLLYLTGLVLLARRYWPAALITGMWLALPTSLPIVLGDPRALQFRYAFVLPLYLMGIAYAVWHLTSGKKATFASVSPQSGQYFIWLLASISFIGTLGIYQQIKPNWREAAIYLNERTHPSDIILIGPLWDEGRFIDYYYRGEAQLLTPAALVTNIEGRAAGLREGNGRIWAVNRFAPIESPASKNVRFNGVVLSEPTLAVYDVAPLTQATINVAAQAVDAAYPWAAQAETEGVLNPDPRTAQAAALRALGDTLLAAGKPDEALPVYQNAVDIFPGWVSGFIALAEAHEATGNLPAAAKAYRQAVTFNLNWQGEAANTAARLTEEENWDTAIEKYHQIIADNEQ